MLCLKEDTHGRPHGIEHTDDGHTVDDVSGKTGNTLCDDEVNFSCFGICDHAIKSISLIQRSAGNTLISVNLHQRPVVMATDHIFVVILLKLVGAGLLDVIRGNTNIDGHALMLVGIVKITLFPSRNNLRIVQRSALVPLPDLCFNLGFGQALGFNFSHQDTLRIIGLQKVYKRCHKNENNHRYTIIPVVTLSEKIFSFR